MSFLMKSVKKTWWQKSFNALLVIITSDLCDPWLYTDLNGW